MDTALHELRKQTGVAAICYTVLGVLFVCFPAITAKTVATLFALAMLILGAVEIAVYFARRSSQLPARAALPVGILLAIAAIVFLIKPELLVTLVYVLLGLSLVVDATFKFQLGLELRAAGAPFSLASLIAGGMAMLLGILAIFLPFDTASAVTVMIGISMILCGLFDAIAALFFIKKQ